MQQRNQVSDGYAKKNIHSDRDRVCMYVVVHIIAHTAVRRLVNTIGVVSHTACKDEFRRNLRSHSWSVF